jgi:alpha-glucosidase (family GH31 glycosyl hydrolase)
MSPRRVMWSGWVGDNHADFPGLQRALRRMFVSSYFHYPNFGSDIAGYLGNTRTRELYLRWSQMGAFCPLMENGGNGDHTPWQYDTPSDNSTTDHYRTLVSAHMSLVAYFMTTGVTAYETNRSSIMPFAHPPISMAKTNQWDTLTAEDDAAWPSRWDYMLGNDIYVVPIVEANVTSAIIHFPPEQHGYDITTMPYLITFNQSCVDYLII